MSSYSSFETQRLALGRIVMLEQPSVIYKSSLPRQTAAHLPVPEEQGAQMLILKRDHDFINLLTIKYHLDKKHPYVKVLTSNTFTYASLARKCHQKACLLHNYYQDKQQQGLIYQMLRSHTSTEQREWKATKMGCLWKIHFSTEQRFSMMDKVPVFLKCELLHFDSCHKIDCRNA